VCALPQIKWLKKHPDWQKNARQAFFRHPGADTPIAYQYREDLYQPAIINWLEWRGIDE